MEEEKRCSFDFPNDRCCENSPECEHSCCYPKDDE